ncbi:hypothetical protein MTO96_052130 [Rhipicephalus appendiculatus]
MVPTSGSVAAGCQETTFTKLQDLCFAWLRFAGQFPVLVTKVIGAFGEAHALLPELCPVMEGAAGAAELAAFYREELESSGDGVAAVSVGACLRGPSDTWSSRRRLGEVEETSICSPSDVEGSRTKAGSSIPAAANAPTEEDKLPFDLKREYKVLIATDDCLLVAFEPYQNGQPQCMIWGTLTGDDIEKSDCYKKSSSCASMHTVWESPEDDPCFAYDSDERRRNEKAKKEEELQMSA